MSYSVINVRVFFWQGLYQQHDILIAGSRPVTITYYSVMGFGPPLAEGCLFMHWAYGGVQRQKHRLDVDDEIFIDWTWVWPMKTLNFGSKRLYKNEHTIEQ